MKKLLILAAIAAAASAQASYLYWQVGSTVTDGSGATWSSGTDYNYAILYGKANENASIASLSSGNTPMGVTEVSLGTDYGENASYLIEVFNYKDSTYNRVAATEWASYADMKDFISATRLETANMTAVWAGAKYNATPEPTSGMMMMLGMALLGLKRRRV